jgi:hypothetical protein
MKANVGTENPRRILFSKWVDPFRVAIEEHKEKGWKDTYSYLENPGQVGVYQGPMIVGPIGFIPVNELNSPSKNFNLWVGHCSFDLDEPTIKRMMEVPGVEIFRVWTRYRFWLGIGKAFEEEEVKRAVYSASALPAEQTPLEKAADKIVNEDQGIEILKKTATAKYQFWAIFIMENGKLDVAGADNKEQVQASIEKRLGNFKRVVTSWDN